MTLFTSGNTAVRSGVTAMARSLPALTEAITDTGTAIDACHALALAGLEGMATVALAPGAMAPGATEAGRGMASAIWQRLPGSQRTQAGALLSALVAGAPVGARQGSGASDYPEFGVWRSLHAHLGLGEAPEWKAPSQPSPRLPGFGP